MPPKSVLDEDVREKRVLVRVDFNVPLDGGKIVDDSRIRAALPTIQHLLHHDAAVVLATHLGRPKGKRTPEWSVKPVADRLSELLGRPVQTVDAVVGSDVEAAAANLKPGEVLLLENTRFEAGEEANDPELASFLARLADLYVNDAFGAAHRAHASTVGVAEFVPACAGLLLQREETALSRLLHEPARPFVAILGGAKVSDKIGVIDRLLDRADALLVGGGMANTLLLAQGYGVGTSLAEPDKLAEAERLLSAARSKHVRLHLPTDVVVDASLQNGTAKTVGVDRVPSDQAIFDIGPETIKRYCGEIAGAGTVFWNGPMGVFERPPFDTGTMGIAHCVADSAAYSVVGGGDSVAAIEAAGVADRIDHVSTGGGASLEFLEGRTLPGIAALPHV
jgi:phosphoglycerate kinase